MCVGVRGGAVGVVSGGGRVGGEGQGGEGGEVGGVRGGGGNCC